MSSSHEKALKAKKIFSNERSSPHAENERYKEMYPRKFKAIKKHKLKGMQF